MMRDIGFRFQRISTCIMILLILCPGTIPASSGPGFEEGQNEVLAILNPPDYEATIDLAIPADFYVLNATMNVTGMAASGDTLSYPENVSVSLDGTVIWAFQKTGFGPLGMQDRFYNVRKKETLEFGAGGGTKTTMIRLPKNAVVQNASMELKAATPVQWNEYKNFTGFNASDWFGTEVSSAGDVNNDGFDDFIIGASCNDSSGNNSGSAYLYFGNSSISDSPDIIFTGYGPHNRFGLALGGAGDVNGDGYDDIIIGATVNDSGRAYIYFGGQVMDNIPDLEITGSRTYKNLSFAVSGAGDVNNDGFDDVIVGEHTISGGSGSGAYIFFGGAQMDNITDITFTGENSGDDFGGSVSGVGDVNNDGYDDVIIGARSNAAGGHNCGRAYLYYGGSSMDNAADVTFTGVAAEDRFGYQVSGAGDVNGDGYDDVLIGASQNDQGGSEAGQAYLFFGGQQMDSAADVTFTGEAADNLFGIALSGAGDVNDDGFDDVIIGTYASFAIIDNGFAYVYYGGQNMDRVYDAKFTGGASNDRFGISVSSAGDINNDGIDEIIIGADGNDSGGTNAGRAYIYSTSMKGNVTAPKITVGSKEIWGMAGPFNGSAVLQDFGQAINEYLQAKSATGSDGFGNAYVDIPVIVSAKSAGNIILSELKIFYQNHASVPDFASVLNGYLFEQKDEKYAGGDIPVPIKIKSTSAGRVRLFGLSITRDMAPSQVQEIGTLELDEDTANLMLLDLYPYFRDDADMDGALNFSVRSSTDPSLVRLWITGRRYLSADAETGDANDNWTGTVEAIVACYDHWGQKTESNTFTITVRNVNDAPLITSSPNLNTEVGVPYYYNVTAVDGDNDVLHYSLPKAPPGLTIDSLTGRIRWMPADRGYFEVNVEVSDGDLTAHQIYYLIVGNIAPRITSMPLLTAMTGVLYVYNVTAEDANNDTLTFSLNSKIIGMEMEATSGRITWTPSAGGSVDVSVRVSDGKLRDEQNFTIIVTQANRAPRFVSKAVTAAAVGVPYQYLAKASDDDGDALGFSLVMAPPGMEVVGSNGRVSWTPVSAGNFSVALKVSDGKGGEAIQEFTINVMERVRPRVEFITPSDGQRVSGKLTVTGVAIKGVDDITKVQLRVDSGDWTDASGTLGWQYSLDTTKLKNGPHTLQVRAFDGTDYSDIVNRTITVDNQKAQGKGFIPGFPGMLAILAVVACAILLSGRRIRFH
jgi:hypothetical protein